MLEGHFNFVVVAGVADPYFDARKVMTPTRGDPIVRSNVAFGGNMAMARNTISPVCDDPYIPRGEDYASVINVYMEGLFFYFLPQAGSVHMPPDSTGSQAADKPTKLMADMRRFIYMREKWRMCRRLFPKGPAETMCLMPYPGVYLDEELDLKGHGVEPLNRMCLGFCRECAPDQFVAEAEANGAHKSPRVF
ncbi:MAG: hypothetical protein N2255_03455 [Kiritimatiellae bacterium]|nr:hypothetical protein [Kiritimatiellia bacterium]